MNKRVAITVSGTIPPDSRDPSMPVSDPASTTWCSPERLDADLIDYAEARRRGGPLGKLVAKLAGSNALLAWACFRSRKRYDSILTDGEQVGIPYAALCMIAGRRRPRTR